MSTDITADSRVFESRIMRQHNSQYPENLNVWAGILGNNIVDSSLSPGNLTCESYCNSL